MARFNARVTLDTRKLNQIIRNLPGNTEQYVRAIAFNVEAKAKTLAPIDTGALRASIYTRTSKQDNTPQAHSAAKAQRPDAKLVELPAPPNQTTAHVGPGVAYALEQEFGSATHGAQPFLTPAVREVERNLARQFAREARRVATDE